jgi:hypothetical protein
MRAEPTTSNAVRSAVGVVLVLGILAQWVRRRDAWSVKIRAFFEQGRAEQARGRTT